MAEAMEILKAIKVVINEGNKKYIIISDSLSTLNNTKNKFKPRDIALKIQDSSEEASLQNNQIILMWGLGH